MKLAEYIALNYDSSFKHEDIPFDIKEKTVAKGTIVYPYLKIEDKVYFLNEGIIETTIIFGDAEKTLSFIFPGLFFLAYNSVISNVPSDQQGMAITDCVYEEFSYSDYKKTCESSLLMNKIGRVELENYALKKIKREKDFLTKTTEEMYLDLIQNTPEVLQDIPLKKIANYFGVLPETISRIRKKIIS